MSEADCCRKLKLKSFSYFKKKKKIFSKFRGKKIMNENEKLENALSIDPLLRIRAKYESEFSKSIQPTFQVVKKIIKFEPNLK